MTVSELIDELRRFPPTAPVSVAERTFIDETDVLETVFSRVDRVEAGSGPDGYGVVILGDD